VVSRENVALNPPDDGLDPPRWLLLSAIVAAGAVLTFGSAGLLLAVNGWYRPALAFPLGAIALAALVWLVYPALPRRAAGPRTARVLAVVGVIAIVALTLWNNANAAQHVLINRDGGVYSELGRWIARSGRLSVPAIGPFKGGAAFPFSFAHLLPVLLAEGYAIGGGSGLYHLPSLLGGIALLEFFVLAWRVLRNPTFALAATLALGFTIPQVTFSRDSYSEIPSQILLFAALSLLADRRGLPQWRIALIAGLFLGATQATRIDAMVFFIGVPVMIAIAWLRAGLGAERRALIAPTRAFLLGLVPGCALGLFDLVYRSGTYWNRLWSNERTLILVAVMSAVVSTLVVVSWRRLLPTVRALPWNALSWVAAGFVGAVAAGAWFVRPHLHLTHEDTLIVFQAKGHLAFQYVRNDYERSMIWMSWYLGPLTLVAAIVGAALLVRALLRGRLPHVVAPLAILLPGALLYLWSASVQPDHVWVMRRFLVGALPMLILLAVGLAARLWTAPVRWRWKRAARIVAAVVVVSTVAFPIYTVIPVASMREEAGYLSVVEDACRVLGPRSAAVMLEPVQKQQEFLEAWATQALRGWCDTPVVLGRFGYDSPRAIRRLARKWEKHGRQLFVIAALAETIRQRFPNARIIPTRRVTNTKLLSTTLTSRPNGYDSQSFWLFIAAIPPQ
jgi:hypothetical protein